MRNQKYGKHKALLFDLGNVLVNFTFDGALAKLSAATGKTIRQIEDFFFSSNLEHRFEIGELTPLEFFEITRTGLKFPGTFKEFAKIWNDIFTENPCAHDLIARLKKDYLKKDLQNLGVL